MRSSRGLPRLGVVGIIRYAVAMGGTTLAQRIRVWRWGCSASACRCAVGTGGVCRCVRVEPSSDDHRRGPGQQLHGPACSQHRCDRAKLRAQWLWNEHDHSAARCKDQRQRDLSRRFRQSGGGLLGVHSSNGGYDVAGYDSAQLAAVQYCGTECHRTVTSQARRRCPPPSSITHEPQVPNVFGIHSTTIRLECRAAGWLYHDAQRDAGCGAARDDI